MSSTTSLTGTIGGVQISALISSQDAVNREGATRLQTQETTINNQTTALSAIQNSINSAYTALSALGQSSLFKTQVATVANTALGNATVDDTAITGSYAIDVLQVASSSTLIGAKANPIVSSTSVAVDSVLGTSVDGTFTLGTAAGTSAQITITSGETIQQLLNDINTGAGANSGVTASYDTTTGKFTLSANDSLLLSNGTSDFLQQAQLFSNYSARSSSGTTLTASESIGAAYSNFVDGTFSLNGVALTVTGSETFQNLIDQINSQIPGVTASLVQGRLTIQSTAPVVVANGTGSFFNQAGLATSSALTTTSSNAIGGVSATAAFGTAGSLVVNGTTVSYSATDTLDTLLTNITSSAAGVVAVYNSYTDQIELTSTNPGPNAITVSDVSGPLSSYGLTANSNGSPTSTVGNSAVVEVNGGTTITSDSNTFTGAELGIQGLTFNATGVGETSISVTPNVTAIANAINTFISAYDSAQTTIATYTTLSTNPTGLDGVLYNDPSVGSISQQLRTIFGSDLYSSGTYRTLADLGIVGNDSNNLATAVDTTDLTDALENHLTDVMNIFANPVSGLYAQMSDLMINEASGGGSVLGEEITANNQQLQNLNDQISQINETADNQKTLLETEYANYESAYQTSQTTISYLNNLSSNSSSSSSSSSSSNSLG